MIMHKLLWFIWLLLCTCMFVSGYEPVCVQARCGPQSPLVLASFLLLCQTPWPKGTSRKSLLRAFSSSRREPLMVGTASRGHGGQSRKLRAHIPKHQTERANWNWCKLLNAHLPPPTVRPHFLSLLKHGHQWKIKHSNVKNRGRRLSIKPTSPPSLWD